jgi:hypothetical protein
MRVEALERAHAEAVRAAQGAYARRIGADGSLPPALQQLMEAELDELRRKLDERLAAARASLY